MNVEVLTLALLTAASWGTSSPLAKLGMERGGSPFQVAVTVVTVSVIIYWSGLIVQGVQVLRHPTWAIALFAITGLFATAVARVLTYNGVQRVGSSVNSACLNTRPVWATVLALVFLGEAVTAQILLGILIVVGGLWALAFSEGGDISGWNLHDLLFPIAAAVTFAAGNVARRFGLSTTGMTALEGVAINETAGMIGLLAYVLVKHGDNLDEFFAASRSAYAYFVACGLLNALALFSLFGALSRGRVVIVDPLSSPTSLFAILVAFLLLGEVERVTRRVIVGAVLVVTGVVLITGPQVLTL